MTSDDRSELRCWHCNAFTGLVGQMEMVGQYKAVLCTTCCNAFHEHIRDHPSFLAFKDIEVEINILFTRTTGDGIDRTDEIRQMRLRGLELGLVLYDLSRAWVHKSQEA